MKNKIRHPYKPETHDRPKTFCKEKSLTEQSHAPDCDINNILMKHNAGDIMAHVKYTQASFGDYTQINEYDEALNTVAKAQQAFEALPSKIREAFNNDPGKYVETVTDPSQREKLVELGMANAIQEEKVTQPNPELVNAVTEMVKQATQQTAQQETQ
jgi:phage internal scaffolding protein